MVLMIAGQEAGLYEWRPTQGLHSLRIVKWELINNSRQPRNLTGKAGIVRSLKKRVNLLSLWGGSGEGGDGVDESDPDEWKPITSPFDSNSGYWQNNAQDSVLIGNYARGILTMHQPCDGGGDKDSQRGQKSVPAGIYTVHLPARHSCETGFAAKAHKFIITILWQGKTHKAGFFSFCWQCR